MVSEPINSASMLVSNWSSNSSVSVAVGHKSGLKNGGVRNAGVSSALVRSADHLADGVGSRCSSASEMLMRKP